MNFFSSFYNSLFNAAWLRERCVSSGKAWGYFLVFTALIALLGIIPFALQISPATKEVRQFVNEQIPEGFRADLKNGKLSIVGIPQPYIFKEEKEPFTFVVNTVATTSLTLKDYMPDPSVSGILIDKEKMEIFDARKKQTKIQYWRDVPDFSFDKPQLRLWLQHLGPVAIIVLSLLFVTFFYIGIIISKLWSILLVSLIVFILSLMMGKRWRFSWLFTIGLYAITLPTLISFVFSLLQIRLPYVHFLALLAFMIAVIFTRTLSMTPYSTNDLNSGNDDNNLGA